MAIHWRLKTLLSTKHAIFSAVGLQKKIIKETGVRISLQNICNLINGRPDLLRLDTAELLCTTLHCQLKDFLEIKGKTGHKITPGKLSYKNTPLGKRTSQVPNPKDYTS